MPSPLMKTRGGSCFLQLGMVLPELEGNLQRIPFDVFIGQLRARRDGADVVDALLGGLLVRGMQVPVPLRRKLLLQEQPEQRQGAVIARDLRWRLALPPRRKAWITRRLTLTRR